MKVNFEKTKVMDSGGIAEDGLSKNKVDPCGVCCLTVKVKSVLCDKWIHGRCAGVRKVSSKFKRNFTCIKCEGNIG